MFSGAIESAQWVERSAYYQVWRPEFDTQDTQGRRRKPTPARCLWRPQVCEQTPDRIISMSKVFCLQRIGCASALLKQAALPCNCLPCCGNQLTRKPMGSFSTGLVFTCRLAQLDQAEGLCCPHLQSCLRPHHLDTTRCHGKGQKTENQSHPTPLPPQFH